MDSLIINNNLSEIYRFLGMKQYKKAIETLDLLDSNIKPIYFVSTSKKFAPKIIDVVIMRLLPLCQHSCTEFTEALSGYLHHYFGLAIAFCPNFLLSMITSLSKSKLPQGAYGYLATSLGYFLERINPQRREEHLPLLSSLIFSCNVEGIKEIPTSAIDFYVEKSTEDDVIGFLTIATTSDLVDLSINLTKKNPTKLVNIILSYGKLQFISQIFKRLDRNYTFDEKLIVPRIEAAITPGEGSDYKPSLKILYHYLDWVTNDNFGAVSNMIDVLKNRLKDDACKEMGTVYKVLTKTVKKGFMKFDDIIEFIDTEKENRRHHSTLVMIENIQQEYVKSKIYDFFELVTNHRNTKEMTLLIKCYIKNYQILKEIDENKFEYIFRKIINPLPNNVKNNYLLTKLLATLPFNDKYTTIIDRIIYDLINNYRTEEQNKYLKEIIKKYKVELQIFKFDFFGEYFYLNIELLPSLPLIILNNLLTANIFKPQNLGQLLEKITEKAEENAPLIYNTILSTTLTCLNKMGLFDKKKDLSRNKIHVSFDKSNNLINQWDIRLMFKETSYSIPESNLGKVLKSLIDSIIILKKYLSLDENHILTLMFVSKQIVQVFPSQAGKLMSSLCSDLHKLDSISPLSNNCKSLALRFQEGFFKPQISYSDCSSIAKAAHDSFGSSSSLLLCKSHIMIAVAEDPECAKLYSSSLEQPLPLMPTFLYFREEKHQQWAQQCKEHFKFNDWIIYPKDYRLIDSLPENINPNELDEKHLLIYNKINDPNTNINEEQQQQNVIESRPIVPRNYKFKQDIEIKEGLNIAYEEPTLYKTISYLWYSKKPLPEDITIDKLQEFSLNNSNDLRIIIGFLSFAIRNNIEINIEEWTKRIKINENDENTFMAASLLLRNYHPNENEEVPKYLKEFIDNILYIIGIYDTTPGNMIEYYIHNSGVKWYFVYNVICIYRNQYTEYDSLIISDIESPVDQQNLITNIIQKLSTKATNDVYIRILNSFSSALMYSSSEYKLTKLLPSIINYHHKVLTIKDTTIIRTPLILGTTNIDSLLSSLNKQDEISYQMIQLSLSLAMTDEQLKKIYRITRKQYKMSPDYFRVILTSPSDIDETQPIRRLLAGSPPSYLRGLFRSFYRHNKGVIHSYMKSVIDVYTNDLIDKSIYPSFCYKPLGKIGMLPWDKANVIEKLRIRLCDLKTLMTAHGQMNLPIKENIEIAETLTEFSKRELFLTKSWPTIEEMKMDFVCLLLEAAASSEASLCFANDAMEVAAKMVPLVKIAKHISTKQFVNSGNFANVYFMFGKAEDIAQDMQEVVDICEQFRWEGSYLPGKEAMRDLFKQKTRDAVKKILEL
ncbi:hypothetical protein GPJ56_007484 [Histomonas meleagridis]|uniref:uncharacterized protein n=1 Tax=Histomonas meleagridis TaxID=135588 RepID=UPI00355A2F9C|nr:hypothetical protein GPJ56_007484 [Histomonas meleagridis]KAH0804330.1 hypothetical protein GO595_003160 [Histomonas meleagridis]